MVGTKGLPTALSQTWCSDDSISFESDEKKQCSFQVVVCEAGEILLLIILALPCELKLYSWKLTTSGLENATIWPCTRCGLASDKHISEI